MKQSQELLSIKSLSEGREQKIENLANRLLNFDFDDPTKVQFLKRLFKEDALQEGDDSFINFLKGLKENVLQTGDFETFKIVYDVREKIKQKKLLTQEELDTALGAGMRHFKKAEIAGRQISIGKTPNSFDLRGASMDGVIVKGYEAHFLLSDQIDFIDASKLGVLRAEFNLHPLEPGFNNSVFQDLQLENGNPKIENSVIKGTLWGGRPEGDGEDYKAEISNSKIGSMCNFIGGSLINSKVKRIYNSDISMVDEASIKSVKQLDGVRVDSCGNEEFSQFSHKITATDDRAKLD